MRVGYGDFVYEVIHDWGRLPAGWSFGSVSNGACDSQGRVYIFARCEHPVLVFSPDGDFLGSWGEGVFSRPHGILITKDDIAWCADDMDHTVRKCTLDGKVLMTLGVKDQPSDTGYDGKDLKSVRRGGPPFNRPTNICLSPSGEEMYVSDGYGNARVHKFKADGTYLFSWGEPGNGPGQFFVPHSVRTDKNGTVYVADRENSRIQVFTPEGKFITQWTDMQKPQGFYMGPDELIYTTEKPVKRPDGQPGFLPPKLSIWNTDGKLLCRWGGEDLSQPGNFFAPHGLWGDRNGDLYVGELNVDALRIKTPPGYPLVHKLVRVK